jgi:gluconokinase
MAVAWLSFADYLHLRWFGQVRTSLSMASATGLFDQAQLSWDEPMARAAGIDPAVLPPIVDVDAPLTGPRSTYAARWRGLEGAIWLPPVGDGACSNLGAGAVGRDRWAITVGTSAAVRAVLHDPPERIPRGLWRYRLDAERAVLGGALNNGGNVYEWLRQTLRLPGRVDLERALLQRPHGIHGLTVDPSLFGERGPHWPLDARGSISGLTSRTTAVDITQALLEAVAARIAEIARLMEDALGPAASIVATGGAMERSAAWRRMLEQALGRAVTPATVQESSLRGAAIVATDWLERYQTP